LVSSVPAAKQLCNQSRWWADIVVSSFVVRVKLRIEVQPFGRSVASWSEQFEICIVVFRYRSANTLFSLFAIYKYVHQYILRGKVVPIWNRWRAFLVLHCSSYIVQINPWLFK